MQNINQAVQDILGVCQPLRIILYAEKRTMATGKLKSISLCVIVPDGADCRALRTRLYLAVSAEVPVSLNVYTLSEWDVLQADSSSYAAWIGRKGQVIYVQAT